MVSAELWKGQVEYWKAVEGWQFTVGMFWTDFMTHGPWRRGNGTKDTLWSFSYCISCHFRYNGLIIVGNQVVEGELLLSLPTNSLYLTIIIPTIHDCAEFVLPGV